MMSGMTFEPDYLKQTFFPKMLEELILTSWARKPGRLAMIVFPRTPMVTWAGRRAARSGRCARRLGRVDRGQARGVSQSRRCVPRAGAGDQVPGDERGSAHGIGRKAFSLSVFSRCCSSGLVFTYRSVSKEVALARLKSDFVSNVSHELRTPLALIRLYAETLELGRIKTHEKAQEYYGIIRKESERLTALINNILDFSRIEAGKGMSSARPTSPSW